MNLPQVVTPADLQRLAAPDEAFAARVVIRQISNTGVYTLRGVSRKYLATRDNEIGAHVIDVPLSVWMHGVPRVYQKNTSVAHDIQSTRHALKVPLVVLIVPWKHAKVPAVAVQAEVQAAPLAKFRKLAELTGAPHSIMAAIDELVSGRPPAEIETALSKAIEAVKTDLASSGGETPPAAAVESPPATASPAAAKTVKSNAQRQKEYRERKAAEKAVAQVASPKTPAKKAAKKKLEPPTA